MKSVRIMLFGTFDGIHQGHINLFKQTRNLALNPFIIVSVARDENVLRIKGRMPKFGQKDRIKRLKKIKLINKVVLGAKGDYISHIVKEKPDIIALGYDQKAYVYGLKKKLSKQGLFPKVVRLLPFYPEKYKSSLL